MKMKWKKFYFKSLYYPNFYLSGNYKITVINSELYTVELLHILDKNHFPYSFQVYELPEAKHLCKIIETNFKDDISAIREFLSKINNSEKVIEALKAMI